jgi:hypothetical protein
VWQFGDGGTSTQKTPTHVYRSPGTYRVTLIVYYKNDNPVYLQKNVKVSLVLNNSIQFSFVPPPTFAGHYNRYPFRVTITSPDVQDHYVNFGCMFSRSDQPMEGLNKWSFLKPHWKFFDIGGKQILKIKTTDTVIRLNESGQQSLTGTFVAGVTGYADFYFTDDIYNFDLAISKQPYTTIIATLDTLQSKDYTLQSDSDRIIPSFANSLAIATCPYILLWRTPDYLKITENGIRPHSNPRWSTSKVPLVVTLNTKEKFPEDYIDGNGIQQAAKESYFIHNLPLTNQEPLSLNISLSNMSAEFSPEPLIEWTDSSFFKTPGYYKGSFDATNENKTNVQILANMSFVVPVLSANYYNPLLWISNPDAGQISVAQHYDFSELKSVLESSLNSSVYNINVPTNNTELFGTHGIFSIAADTMPGYHAWMVDTDSQYLYRVAPSGEIILSIDINEMISKQSLGFMAGQKATPLSIVMDGNKDLWITLKDSISTIKLDKYGEYILAVSPITSAGQIQSIQLPNPSELNVYSQHLSLYDQSSYFNRTSSFDSSYLNYLIQPSYIDSDTDNNVYVSYTNPFSSFIVKYDTNGNLLDIRSSVYADNETPQEMVCDNLGNLWVSVTKNTYPATSFIEKRSSDGSLLYYNETSAASFGPFNNANYLTIDSDQNLWFTHGYRNVGKINTNTYTVSSIEVYNDSSFTNNEEWALDGICADATGRIFVINSVENQIYVIDKDSMEVRDSFFVNPQGYIHYFNSKDSINKIYNPYNKSAIAQGDWSGFRWMNKYANSSLPEYSTEEQFITINGVSRSLDFYTDTSYNYNFAKNNEDYNFANTLKDLAFTPALVDSENLFDNFFGAIFGKEPLSPQDLGVTMYEKIANFVQNHNDIDTCNIDELYSNASMVDLETDDFKLNYPPAIKRLMDLASINYSRLRGGLYDQGREFSVQDANGIFNRGKMVSSFFYTVTAGVPIVMRTKSTYDPYKIIYTGKVNGKKYYDLDELSEFLNLQQPWKSYYEFFEYNSLTTKKYMDGVIDWYNPQTTISFYNSSANVWEGNEGVLETALSYELYKGLNLLNS